MRWTTMWRLFLALVGLGVLGWSVPAGESADGPRKEVPKKVVIPFDFESRFDKGEYGRMIGDMIWKKLERRGGFVIPESMLDVRAWSKQSRLLPGPDTPLAKMNTIVCKENGGDIGIWGKVERVSGADTDVYDLWICVADFSADPVKVIYRKKVRTKTVSEIPHTYVKEALDRLYGGSAEVIAAADPGVKERWQKGPNLVKGDLQQGRSGPRGWDPLPKHVSWVFEGGRQPRHRIVRFTIPPDVAETTGVLYYSDYFPVEAGATYRFQCRWRSTGTAVKVFVKCYAELPSRYGFKSSTSSGTERREVYRSQQNLKGPAGNWNVHTEDFTPNHKHYPPRWGRVMLYGYYPAGKVEWDDIVVKQIAPAPRK
jgi:hypothetical protein